MDDKRNNISVRDENICQEVPSNDAKFTLTPTESDNSLGLSLADTSIARSSRDSTSLSLEDLNTTVTPRPNMGRRGSWDFNPFRQSGVKQMKKGYSFDDIFSRSKNYTAEMMDFVDDSDNWSQASCDSSATEPLPPASNYLTPTRPEPSKTPIAVQDSSRSPENLDSLASPGGSFSNPLDSTQKIGQDGRSGSLHSNYKRGLSQSMILNWIYAKKYPTITEINIDGDSDSVDTKDGAIVPLAVGSSPSKEGASSGDPPGGSSSKLKFTYRDLNAVAPSNW